MGVHKQITHVIHTDQETVHVFKNPRRDKRQNENYHVLSETISFHHKDIYVVLLYYLKTQQDLLKRNTSTVKQASERISPLILCYFMLPALVHDSSFSRD